MDNQTLIEIGLLLIGGILSIPFCVLAAKYGAEAGARLDLFWGPKALVAKWRRSRGSRR